MVNGFDRPLTALVDSGATNNFIKRSHLIRNSRVKVKDHGPMVLRLADGKSIKMPKLVASLRYQLHGISVKDEFYAIDMDERFDCILGMPWLTRHRPEIDWQNRSIKKLSPVLDSSINMVLSHTQQEETTWMNVAVYDLERQQVPDVPVSDGPAYPERQALKENPLSKAELPRSQVKTTRCEVCNGETSITRGVGIKTEPQVKSAGIKAGLQVNSVMKEVQDAGKKSGPQEVNGVGRSSDVEEIEVLQLGEKAQVYKKVIVESPPKCSEDIIATAEMSLEDFMVDLSNGEITQVCVIVSDDYEEVNVTSTMDVDVAEKSQREKRYEAQSL